MDAIVDYVRRGSRAAPAVAAEYCAGDPDGQCGLEAAAVFGSFYLTGRIAAREELLLQMDIQELVRETYRSAGYGFDAAGYDWKPGPKALGILANLCFGPFAEGERELRHLADDQAICVGYANALQETNHLPPAHWLARKIARQLYDLRKEKGAGQVGPDAKVIVRVESDGTNWQPLHVSISLNHHQGSDWLLRREIAEEAVAQGCGGKPTPALELNGAGMFVCGGPNGDNGLSGKKLVVDAYGPTVPIGGGAWSGKDLHKVDRLGGLLARKLAKLAIGKNLGREALVTLEYIPGCERPVAVDLRVDGKIWPGDALEVLGDPVVDNQSVWKGYVEAEIDLPALARWGHQAPGMPWE